MTDARLTSVMMLCGCVQTVDLRAPADDAPTQGDPACAIHERFDPTVGICVPCELRTPEPEAVCPCDWHYQPAELPYCDTPQAFYQCLSCSGTIASCTAYDLASSTTNDCLRLTLCCDQLAVEPDSEPCCDLPAELQCAFDGASTYLVGCMPPDCCEGAACPGGSGDCESWQTCFGGICVPPCSTDQVCEVAASEGQLICVCNDLTSPP